MKNAIYGHFWLPRIKKEILWNQIPEKYSLQWCSVGQIETKLLSSFSNKNAESKTLKVVDGHSYCQVWKTSRPLNYSKQCKWEIESRLSKKIARNTWKTLDDQTKYHLSH